MPSLHIYLHADASVFADHATLSGCPAFVADAEALAPAVPERNTRREPLSNGQLIAMRPLVPSEARTPSSVPRLGNPQQSSSCSLPQPELTSLL